MHLPDLALARPPSSAFAAPADLPAAAQIGRVDVFASLDQARSDWAELEAIAPASPYQRFAFADAWFETIGAAIGAAPFIVVARELSGAPAALLPLALRRRGPFAVATFLGGKDSNFNLGLFRPGPPWSASGLRSIVVEAARAAPARVDCFALLNQPRAWQYSDNPVVALGGRAGPSFGYKTKLPATFGA
jgi:CelD/BcsL family acetyltransferase involved in cellulose biosynthesis